MRRVLLLWLGLSLCGAALALDLTPQELAGKRVYREGLASGDGQIVARVGTSDMSVPATVLPCASCHGSDGRGRAEGGVRPPSLDWQRMSGGQGERQTNGRSYPGYTDGGLARAVQQGVDPGGNRLDPAMPRFVMSMADQRNLTAYLKRLGEERDPGLEQDVLRLGTLLPSAGPLAEPGRVVQAVLADGLAQLNEQGGIHGRQLELVVIDPGPDALSAGQALAQLLEQADVFAMISPLAPQLDTQLAAELERRGVPLIGSTPRSGGSSMIFDPMPGMADQLLSLAEHAREGLGLARDGLQVVYAGQEQAVLANALRERLQQLGWNPAPAQAFSGQAVAGQGLVFLGRPQAFAELADTLQAAGRQPYLFAASSQVSGALPHLSPEWSQRLFLAYPFIPGDWSEKGRVALAGMQQRQGLDARYASLQVNTLCALRLLTEALRQAGRDVSRERLVTALEGLHDIDTGLTPGLSFGPGRRQGLAGAHVIAVALPGPRFEEVAPYRPVPATR